MTVRVGVGVIIERDGKILLGLRKSEHGEGKWGFVGGHLEHGESPEDCVRREAREEIGTELENLRRFAFTNDVFEDNDRHYITIFMKATLPEGQEPRVMEPESCVEWAWFAPDALPESLFLPVINLMKAGYSLTGGDAGKRSAA